MTQLAKDSRLISKYLVSVHDGSALACTPVFALVKRIETDFFYQQIDRSRLMQTVNGLQFRPPGQCHTYLATQELDVLSSTSLEFSTLFSLINVPEHISFDLARSKLRSEH